MPTVAEELAALKQRSLTKNFAEKLKDADGLSTPEQEQANLQKTSKTNRASVYKKDAVQTLNAGTKAVDQDLAFKQKQIAQKKQDMQKKEEAAKNLKSFNTAKVAATPGGGSQPKQQKKGGKSAAKAPTAADIEEVASDDEYDLDDVPDLKEAEGAIPDIPEGVVEEIPEGVVGDIPDLQEVEEIPELVNNPSSGQYAPPPQPPKRVPNRAEKKAKKTVEKLGLKGVSGIARVTLKLGGNQGFYTIFQPDVYVSKTGTYVVFGEAQQGAGGAMEQQAQAARAAKMLDTPVPTPSAATAATTTATTDAAEPALDETGLEAKDIELVISQAGCSRNKAVTALRENNGDLVNAIMSLTT